MQRNNLIKGIIATLAYSDIFDYPLTSEEILRYFFTESSITYQVLREDIGKRLKSLVKQKVINYKQGFYYLKGREEIVSLRIKRERIAQNKLITAKKYANILSLIPTVQCIGISGSLAMNNTEEDADIDFFIITSTQTLWITRLLIFLVLVSTGKKRERNKDIQSNKICVNMLIDERSLLLPKNKQNIFTAHEVIQMKPLFVRNHSYDRFTQQNMWVKRYLPNAASELRIKNQELRKRYELLRLFETLAKKLQLWYMKNHRTKEVITDTLIAFHPNDNTQQVLTAFENKIKQYNL